MKSVSWLYLSEVYKKKRLSEQKTTPQIQTINENKIQKTNLMETEKVVFVALDSISPNPDNSRKKFKQEELIELAHRIKEHGLLHAIILRVKGDGYEIVYGERRYRAFTINEETHIPAIIRDYTDEQILEITLVENINRQDLSIIEESDAYQKLMDVHQYSVDDICHKLGKSDAYIRNRLRLQNLIDDFKDLLEKGNLSIGVGLETAKLSKQLQKQIFKEHFTNEENNWIDLSVKEYIERVDKLYTNELSQFNFDMKECDTCRFNTAFYELFPEKSGKCTNRECLLQKKNAFTADFCKVVFENFPDIDICIAPCDKINPDIERSLEEVGLTLKTMKVEEILSKPSMPLVSDYASQEEYMTALEEYEKIEEPAFSKEIDEVVEKVKSGEIKKVVYIGNNNPTMGYVRIIKGTQMAPLQILEKQDKDNAAIAVKNIVKEISGFLQTQKLPKDEVSVFEDELILFIMLDFLDKKYFSMFGFENQNKEMLTEEEKYKIIKSISTEQRSIICRNYLQNNLVTRSGGNIKNMFLIEFSKQHFEKETIGITQKHKNIYTKKYVKIQNRIQDMKKEKLETVF